MFNNPASWIIILVGMIPLGLLVYKLVEAIVGE